MTAVDGRAGDLAYFRVGSGPPLMLLPGLGPTNEPSAGFARRIELRYLRGLAASFTVYSIYRRVGLAAGVTVAEIAGECADAIRALVNEPVPIVGISTGGNSAIQIGLDHPELATHLVLISTGAALSRASRAACETACQLALAGRIRACNRALTAAAFGPGLIRSVVGWIAWLTAPMALPRQWNPSDMVRTMRADNAFDATDSLGRIRLPTLIINGTEDPSFPPDHSKLMAERIPNARLLLYRAGHGGVLMRGRLWRDVAGFIRGEPAGA